MGVATGTRVKYVNDNYPANIIHSINVGSILYQRHRKLSVYINPSTASTDYTRFLYFLLPYCISAFKQVEDIK